MHNKEAARYMSIVYKIKSTIHMRINTVYF
jgi:hypothetical protein